MTRIVTVFLRQSRRSALLASLASLPTRARDTPGGSAMNTCRVIRVNVSVRVRAQVRVRVRATTG